MSKHKKDYYQITFYTPPSSEGNVFQPVTINFASPITEDIKKDDVTVGVKVTGLIDGTRVTIFETTEV